VSQSTDGVLVGPSEHLPSAPSVVGSARLVDRLSPRVVRVSTAVGFGAPAIAYLWMFVHYSVNIVVGDQWDDVTVIRASYHQVIPWEALWAQHNENRMFFPNLLVIALSRTTHFNVHIEELLGVLLLFAAIALLIWTHKRRTPDTPWLYYCPVALLALTLAQWENTLWGFQVAWYMILLALVVALYLLDRPSMTVLAFAGAATASFVGSLSSSQGLLIWPAGLVLLYHRRRSWPFVVTWCVAAVGTAALYLHDLNLQKGNSAPHYASTHLVASVKFFLFAIGDVVGVHLNFGQSGSTAVLAFGAVLVVVAVALLVFYGIRPDNDGPAPLGLSLIVVGLLFAATVTQGRSLFGYFGASASRYTTFDVLVPLGIYLTVVARRPAPAPSPAGTGAEVDRSWEDRMGERADRLPRWADEVALRWIRVVIGLAIVIQVGTSIPLGIQGARNNYVYQAQAVPVLRNIAHYPDGYVAYHLYVFSNAKFLRAQAAILEVHHLNIFATGGIWP